MFDKFSIRCKIALIWLLAFISLWIAFYIALPLKSIENQLNKIEESIQVKNWDQAKEYTSDFRNTFNKNKVFIQMNNATEALIAYENAMGQLEMAVKGEQESALEYVGALRETTNLVIKPFSGP